MKSKWYVSHGNPWTKLAPTPFKAIGALLVEEEVSMANTPNVWVCPCRALAGSREVGRGMLDFGRLEVAIAFSASSQGARMSSQ